MLSQLNSKDKKLLEKLSNLIETYNEYLEKTDGTNQLDIHKEIQDIIDRLKKFIPQ